ncbi:MAG: CHASE2 domain-containing protein [Deltaproteobacteria bacterium]|nr:CHASE2 domain-containing protein [Deltaproteobacteria bacterium]
MKINQFKREDILMGVLAAVVFIFFSFNSYRLFDPLERIIYSIEMRLDSPTNLVENHIAIVNIDDKSIDQMGSWPWPRHRIAEMISILKDNGAKLIGLDMLYSAKEQTQGLEEVRDLRQAIMNKDRLSEEEAWMLERLREAEQKLDNDHILCQAVKASENVILPVEGRFGHYSTEVLPIEGSSLDRNALRLSEIRRGFNDLESVNQLTMPFSELSENTLGLGHINFPPLKRMEGRSHLLFIDYKGHIIPSMPFRLAMDYLDKEPEQAITSEREIRLTKPIKPTAKGEIYIKFRGGNHSFPYYSFVDIWNVRKVPAVFSNKIVLIGFSGEGAPKVNTPVDPRMPYSELRANIIENLIIGRYLRRPPMMIYVECLLILLFCLFASAFQSRLSLINRTGVTVGLLFLVLLIGTISFATLNIWLNTVYIILSLIAIYAVQFFRDLLAKQKELRLRETIETNRMLGLTLQSQGLFDLAFEKFRKVPLDDAMKDVVYNLGLDYERKRMANKAIAVYEYILQKDKHFRDLKERIPKLKKVIGSVALGGYDGKKTERIVISDDMEIRPTVGRYEVISELGQGAMGIVYKARDPKIDRLLAIKTIRFSDEFEETRLKEIKDRFYREARISGQLSHPSIVAVYDVGEDYDLSYLVMEFLTGESLQKYCKKENLLSLRRTLNILAQTADALDYAHRHEVIHRDVKPANIMLLENDKIKVTDFGIAKAISDSKTKSGIVLGTPNYMSPEQINGHELDGRSDIFSLGVVFFELLTGQLPFGGSSLANLFYRITQGKHPSPRQFNPRVPTPVEQILDKSLEKTPDKRFQTAGELAKYLRILMEKMDELTGGAKQR